MRKRDWKRWAMAAATVALLVGPMPAQASELGNEVSAETAETEVSQGEVPVSVEASQEVYQAQSSGITSTVDGNTIVFTGEGNASDLRVSRYSGISHIKFQNCKVVGSMNELYSGNDTLRSVDFHGLDTSQVTDMGRMFLVCGNLTNVDLSGLNTSQVTNMENMFAGCISLRSLDLSGFDTSKVTDMSSMFNDCSSLTSLNVSGFDTSKVENMSSMFGGCNSLTSLNVSSFDTSKVGNMGSMFRGCSSLTNLDLSGFDTSLVTDMGYMFGGCNSLTSLDLSSFDTSIASASWMFDDCDSLRSLKTPRFMGAKTIWLGATYLTPDGRETGDLKEEFCNTTLIRKGVSAGGEEVFAAYDGHIFTRKDGQVRCYKSDGTPVINGFRCDGTYTYYFQLDGTAMKDRLTYHPDGIHIIYFDENGHEVFSDFANVRKSIAGDDVNDMCFFNVYGYMYVDTLTYDRSGKKLYYVNPYGVLERKGWFAFSGNEFNAGLGFSGRAGGYGYANDDCSLIVNKTVYDWEGQAVYVQGDGHMFKD